MHSITKSTLLLCPMLLILVLFLKPSLLVSIVLLIWKFDIFEEKASHGELKLVCLGYLCFDLLAQFG